MYPSLPLAGETWATSSPDVLSTNKLPGTILVKIIYSDSYLVKVLVGRTEETLSLETFMKHFAPHKTSTV